MNKNIVLETKMNKEGVYEVIIDKGSTFWTKVKSAYEKVKSFVLKKAETVKSFVNRIFDSIFDSKTKQAAVKLCKNIAIATGVSIAWGVVMPSLWAATIASALTITGYKHTKTYVKASLENVNYKFSVLDFTFDAFDTWCYAIIGAGLLTWIVPTVLDLVVYAWIFGLILLLA
ncbi:hypothetical protein [Parageobacillus galactosidasius]|uniref:Uncharacterized protein n=1 Tax=Parageobacillus galactosidasius TaxID=883812 RepID=A0A226QS99_9BACL|nr:hypothetical protein [Parageobacillus galactosidasius]OXB94788.1 hypothetical protein B9L23_07965 [Parageobacillus galactosidasius]